MGKNIKIFFPEKLKFLHFQNFIVPLQTIIKEM
jgi:hypothetical protein